MARGAYLTSILFAAALSSCGDDGLVTDPSGSGVAQVRVTPAADTLVALNAGVTLTAQATDADGNAVSGVAFAWASSAPAVATVDGNGVVTAAAVGTATITATSNDVSGEAAVTVIQQPALLAVTREPSTGVADEPLDTMMVEIRDAGGSAIPDATESVSVSLAANPGGATLGGTTTVPASGGMAVFTDLALDAAGDGYTLVAAASGLAPDTSAPFRVFEPLPLFTTLVVDEVGTVVQFPAIAVGGDGRVHLSYYDSDNADLKYATCLTACTDPASWETATVQSAGSAGRWSALAVDGSGVVHVAFFAYYGIGPSNGDLGYAVCAADCTLPTSWDTVTVVDTTDQAGVNVDLALDGGGGVHLSYKAVDEDLHYATCSADCLVATSWQRAAVDTAGRFGGFATAIAVAGDGRVHVLYVENEAGGVDREDVRYATCAADCGSAGNWTTATLAVGGYLGESHDLAVDGAGVVHVAYTDWERTQVRYATCPGGCDDPAAWQSVDVDSSDAHVALAVEPTGVVHLARYLDDGVTATLRYARCFADCTTTGGWSFSTVEAATGVGRFVDLAVDPSGAPHLAYMDMPNGDLRYAR